MYTRPLRGLVWYSAFAAVPPTRALRSGYPSDHDTLSAHCWDVCIYVYMYTYEHGLSRHVWCTPLECTFDEGKRPPEHFPFEFREESALKSTLLCEFTVGSAIESTFLREFTEESSNFTYKMALGKPVVHKFTNEMAQGSAVACKFTYETGLGNPIVRKITYKIVPGSSIARKFTYEMTLGARNLR